ncbi:MAG: M56 family metallopeptidase [Bacteroidales bacterium]|nr:M56 family metallopeptidase [Bacteroidales bacterium]
MFLAFLFKWAIALTLLYSLYGLLLRRETFYRVNRFVLLAMLPLSAWLATQRLETTHINAANQAVESTVNWLSQSGEESGATPAALTKGPAPAKAPVPEASAEGTASPTEGAAALFPHSAKFLLWLYLAGLLVVALQYLFALIQVIRIIRKGHPMENDATNPPIQGAIGVVNDAVDSPFSWFRWIVISSKDLADNGRVFLAHERAHVSHGHSWDMLLCEFCVRLQWFNPFAWQLREDLRAVHEFQADQSVIKAGCNVREYNMLLIDKALGGQLAPVANALTQGELKNHIRMMHRKPSPWMAMLKVLYIVPFVLITLAIFAKPIAVQNIVNARSVDVLAQNVKTLVNPTVGDAAPLAPPERGEETTTASAPQQPAKEPAEQAPAAEPSAASSVVSTPTEAPAPAARPRAVEQPEDPHVAEIKASSPYQRQRAEKAIEDYLNLSIPAPSSNVTIGFPIEITIDREGNITDVQLRAKVQHSDKDWERNVLPDIERKARTIPHELTRDYARNSDFPDGQDTQRLTIQITK